MSVIIKLEEIRSIVKSIDVIEEMQKGFIQYSNGNSVVPPVGELLFDHPPGDVHIKYGYIKGDDFYVIKIASGFYENPKLGIPSGQGLMLLFNQKTGQLEAVLLDEGYLTDIRTAAAGSLAARYYAPKEVKAIGIIGTGVQARLQLQYLQQYNPCKTVWLWGRSVEHARQMKSELGHKFDIHLADTCAEVARNAKLIVTTTPSNTPLLLSSDIQTGTLIVAVGSDTQDKQELDSDILHRADLVIGDSLPQSKSRGEIYQAIQAGSIKEENVVELGTAIQNTDTHRTNDEQIIVVDLTGVAVQDMMIASAVYLRYTHSKQ
jgi:ornithine cyclodeaminase